MDTKEKLKNLAKNRGTEDYSAKAEYIDKGGMMGKGEVFEDEKVTTSSRGSVTTHTTRDTETVGKGKPTAILARTIKGYGLGDAGEGRNITHNQKKT